MLHAFFARLPDGRTVLFSYNLLGGDTVAPSGLFARLRHVFLVGFVPQLHIWHDDALIKGERVAR